MKKRYILAASAALCMLVSCGGESSSNGGGTKFKPTERVSSLSDSERENAIAAKRAELNVDIKSMLASRDVKLTVLPPDVDGNDITENIVTRIATKMLQVAAANGIGGIGNVPGFVLSADFAQTGREATGTVPQKMTVQYEITYKVVNTITGDVYGTTAQNVMGVGQSFEEANRNMVQEIKNTPAIQEMLKSANEKILAWYNDNFETFKNQVESAEGQRNYALALAMVEAVPQKAEKAFAYATERQPDLLKKLQLQHSAESFAALQTAVTKADGEFSAEVAALMSMIPNDSPEFKKAQDLYASYEKRIDAKNAEKKEEAQKAAERAHEKELAEIEAEKMKVKYQTQATAKAMEHDMQRKQGFWSTLGMKLLDSNDNDD